jgi:hypothetical protein
LAIDNTATASLTANQFTLIAGTYRIRASAPAYRVDRHQIRLWNATDANVVAYGTCENADSAANGLTRSTISYRFTITANKTFEIQHQCLTSEMVDGFGLPNAFSVGNNQIYTVVELLKEAD